MSQLAYLWSREHSPASPLPGYEASVEGGVFDRVRGGFGVDYLFH